MTRQLTDTERREGFMRATGGFSRSSERWAERAARDDRRRACRGTGFRAWHLRRLGWTGSAVADLSGRRPEDLDFVGNPQPRHHEANLRGQDQHRLGATCLRHQRSCRSATRPLLRRTCRRSELPSSTYCPRKRFEGTPWQARLPTDLTLASVDQEAERLGVLIFDDGRGLSVALLLRRLHGTARERP